jgi:hypothetical protein
MLTAVTTAQIESNDLIPKSLASNLAIFSLILATLNTFFRPHTQYATNTEFLTKWTQLGVKFEDEYYNNMVEHKTIGAYRKRLESLQSIQKEVNALRQAEGTNTINFLTDFLFLICLLTCLRNKKNWLDRDRTVEKAAREKIELNAIKKLYNKTSSKLNETTETTETIETIETKVNEENVNEENEIVHPPNDVKLDVNSQV